MDFRAELVAGEHTGHQSQDCLAAVNPMIRRTRAERAAGVNAALISKEIGAPDGEAGPGRYATVLKEAVVTARGRADLRHKAGDQPVGQPGNEFDHI